MKKAATLLSCFVFIIFPGFSQYLAPAFQGKTVSLKLVHSSMYVRNSTTQPYQDYEQPDFHQQEWILENVPGKANWYWIRQAGTNNYFRVNVPLENQNLLMDDADAPEQEMWEFQFVAQPEYGRYKIHTRYNQGGVALVLEVDPSVTTPALLRLGKNKSSGNEQHQKFDLTDLYPPSDPGSAVASLANRFEGRTVGMKCRYFDKELRGNGGTEDVKIQAGYADFGKEFRLDYTNETGWYKIRHKPSGKYVTIVPPIVDGGIIKLKFDSEYDDDQQKFKFVVQTVNDYTYKIHSKYSEGTPGFKKALVLEFNAYDESSSMRLKKNITSGQDQWQQFVLHQTFPTAAEFTDGPPVTQGKIMGKQYYISNLESLALIEPHVVGADTFVRIQQSPVYGEQSEWTFDEGGKHEGKSFFRIRYGKTGQYLYLTSGNSDIVPSAGTRVRLKTYNGSPADRKYWFSAFGDGTTAFTMNTGLGNTNSSNKDVIIDDDGYLSTTAAARSSYIKNWRFYLNLSLPVDSTKNYTLATKNQGHFLTDSAVLGTYSAIVHQQSFDYSCDWKFIPLGNDIYYIRNNLTRQYLSNISSTITGTQIYTASLFGSNSTKWEVIRDGNYYKIKNVQSGYYLAILNEPESGKPVYQAANGSAGSLFIITRSDYFTDPPTQPFASVNLLDNYAPLAQNAFNNNDYRDKMIRNLGLPFEPSFQNASNLQTQGFTGTPPNFYAVVRSALVYKFNYSSTHVDNAIRNYKLDLAGHRVQLAFALRSYILENLAVRSRASWTYNELELVKWIERKIKTMKEQYADRLYKSWGDFKGLLYESGSDLPLTALLGADVDYSAWDEPDYYIPTDPQAASIVEYTTISMDRNYKNPGDLATLTVPSMSAVAGTVLGSIVFNNTVVAAANIAVQGTIADIQAGVVGAEKAYQAAVGSARFMGNISSISATSFIASVAAIATQILIMRAMDIDKILKFEDALNAKIDRLRTKPISLTETMQAKNLMSQFYLCQDIDFILGGGERFDNRYENTPMFVGNGNWSNPANWSNSQVPANPVGLFTQIIINPTTGGECVLDVPVQVNPGGSITVNSSKTFRVISQ